MRNFATESGKSKGQFYTPSEVNRIAKVLGIDSAETSSSTTVYDPTCGSGSLLLKVGDEAGSNVTLNGQEKDGPTVGLAYMSMILHNYPTAVIKQGNTLANPQYVEGDALKTFDYVVANPPFPTSAGAQGLIPPKIASAASRATVPPPNRILYLLHIIRSLKSTGKGACILPRRSTFEAMPRQTSAKSWCARASSKASSACLVLRHRHSCLYPRPRQARRTRARRASS